MRRVQYARCETKTAYLSSDFGKEYAVRLFGQAAIDSLPQYVRGKRKGLTKGILHWTRCVEGGWDSKGGIGGVCYPGFVDASVTMPEGWERTYREIMVLHTIYPSHEKRLAAEARDAAHQTESDAAQAAYETEIRSHKSFIPRIPLYACIRLGIKAARLSPV